MMPIIKKLSEPRNLLWIGICYTLCITAIFFTPASEIPKLDILFFDKIAHVAIHGLLCFVWLWYGFRYDKNHISSRIVFVVLIACFCYGVVIEAFQHWFTLTRTFDLFDVVANGVGSLLGLFVFWKLQNRISIMPKQSTNGNQKEPEL
ncbi:VanZ family protein [Altibacter sp.]|uniref:VanZ family protein n=1 Tax=Altibacter sp. TaxID=2024823 RepID=UPI003418C346